MRQGKVSALIHKSAAMPNCNSCTVEIHFRNVIDVHQTGTTTTVPGSELVVSRQAFKNNTSKYFINNRDSSFTEVTKLMRDKGIDLDHKRFLILQGEVESIAQMKPKADNDSEDGMLEYLEDIIGTSRYKSEIEESETQLESLNDDCATKANRLDIVKREIAKLQDEKNVILKHLANENKLTMKKSLLFQSHIHHLNKKIHEKATQLQKVKDEYESGKAEFQNAFELSQSIETDIKNKAAQKSAIQKQHQSLSKQLSKRSISSIQLEEKSKHLSAKTKKLEKQIASAQHAVNELNIWLQHYEEGVASLKNRNVDLGVKLEEKRQEYEQVQQGLKGKTEEFTSQIEAIENQLAPWNNKILTKKAEIKIADSNIALLQEKIETARTSIQDAKDNLKKMVSEGQFKEQKIVTLTEELEHVTQQIQIGEKECARAETKLSAMNEDVEDCRQRFQAAQESISSVNSQSAVLKSLSNLSNSGRITGFHGRLGSLATIDPKYDIAISTACPELENLVVETVKVGEECVQYLKRNNIGRAKFILLDKLPNWNIEKNFQSPLNAPRLFDLINPVDEKFLPAFYTVLRDTLVAENVDDARKIAYGTSGTKYKVVTLDGILIDPSGTITGGGNISKGRMSTSNGKATSFQHTNNPAEFERLKEELEKKEAKYTKAQEVFEKMSDALQNLKKRKPEIELEISKLHMDIEALTENLNEAKKEYNELK